MPTAGTRNAIKVLEQSVVVSKNYLPLNRVSIRRTIALLVTSKAQALDVTSETEWQVYSARLKLYVPASHSLDKLLLKRSGFEQQEHLE